MRGAAALRIPARLMLAHASIRVHLHHRAGCTGLRRPGIEEQGFLCPIYERSTVCGRQYKRLRSPRRALPAGLRRLFSETHRTNFGLELWRTSMAQLPQLTVRHKSY